MKMFITHLKRLSKPQVTTLVLILAFVAVGITAYGAIKSKRNRPKAATLPAVTISNTATIQFCTDGDTTADCDVASSKYTGTATSNTVTTTLESVTPANGLSSICYRLTLQGRRGNNYGHQRVATKLSKQDGTILSSQTITSNAAGDFVLPLPTDKTIDPAENYTLTVKPAGFLQRSQVITDLTDDCRNIASNKPFILGDLNDDNKIGFEDLALAIRAYNNQSTEITTAAFMSQKPVFTDLITIIRHYNQSPEGE
jgi:hypothetical protein